MSLFAWRDACGRDHIATPGRDTDWLERPHWQRLDTGAASQSG